MNFEVTAYSSNGHGEVNSYMGFKLKGTHRVRRVYGYWDEKTQTYIEENVNYSR